MGWRSRRRGIQNGSGLFVDSLVYGCAYGVAVIITLVIVVPGLIVLQLYFPRFWWIWTLIGAFISFIIIRFIYVPAIERTKSEIEQLEQQEFRYLIQKYPDLWRQVVRERLQQGLLVTIKRTLHGDQKSMYEEFLERVLQREKGDAANDT